MKRRLISYDVFENIQNSSVSNSEKELIEAGSALARALQISDLTLDCYNPEDVVYETTNGYIKANYKINESFINFQNIEQLIIDEETELQHGRELLGKMLEAILNDKENEAEELFSQYIQQNKYKRDLSESVVHKKDKKKEACQCDCSVAPKAKKNAKASMKFKTKIQKRKKLKEWRSLAENVFGFVDYKTYGPVLKETVLGYDEKGGVDAVKIPTIKAKNEGKILSFNWKTLNTDIKVLRSSAKKLAENTDFCKEIAKLKRSNAISDNEKMQECLEDIVSKWSSLLYLTQNELSVIVSEALSVAGSNNYDDQICDFIAEALLFTAHDLYVDRVAKVTGLAGIKSEDIASENAYETFKNIVDNFYPKLDEDNQHEMQVYVDLYENLREVYEIADQIKNDYLKKETAGHLNDLASIIRQEVEPSLDVAVAAAEWLNNIVETNLEAEDWDVSNNVHITVNGDHPRMQQLANKGYSPSADGSGDWSDAAPVSDGKNYKGGLAQHMRNDGWGNVGDDSYPTLQNPYIPKPYGDYKISGEKSIENDDQLGQWGNGNTWPTLQNPYIPSAETPQSYQINNGKEADAVVNK